MNKTIFIVFILLIQGDNVAQKKVPLSEYQKKRHFGRTPEPKPKIKKIKKIGPLFVIQKHAASHLHYDLRLEIGGVMPSWAVPKGLPIKTNDRRLAMMTEDHPVDYANFEGTIPEGEYGAGTVMIWDYGTYENLRNISIEESIKEGKIEFFLNGKKIKGAYVLIHTGKGDQEKRWLVLKMQHEPDGKKATFKINEKSAKTGRTMNQITKEESSQ